MGNGNGLGFTWLGNGLGFAWMGNGNGLGLALGFWWDGLERPLDDRQHGLGASRQHVPLGMGVTQLGFSRLWQLLGPVGTVLFLLCADHHRGLIQSRCIWPPAEFERWRRYWRLAHPWGRELKNCIARPRRSYTSIETHQHLAAIADPPFRHRAARSTTAIAFPDRPIPGTGIRSCTVTTTYRSLIADTDITRTSTDKPFPPWRDGQQP